MSWLWGTSQESKDSTKNLDAGLRDFLDKETAQAQLKTQPKQQDTKTSTSPEYKSQLGLEVPGARYQDQQLPPAPATNADLPEQSQFQDGRYAHLWKTYRTPEQLAAVSQTDQDKLTAISQNHKNRTAAIGRAAIENCVVEQLEQQKCFSSGSWSQLATWCREENKSFNRCYNMQQRFLKALGYLSVPRSAEEEDKIQAHADKLYTEMLQRERALKDAKEKGIELDPAKPLILPDETMKALGPESAWAQMRQEAIARGDSNSVSATFTKEQQAKLMAAFKGMTEEERALELQLLAAEKRVTQDLHTQMQKYWHEEREERRQRREAGQERLGDKIKRYSGWQD